MLVETISILALTFSVPAAPLPSIDDDAADVTADWICATVPQIDPAEEVEMCGEPEQIEADYPPPYWPIVTIDVDPGDWGADWACVTVPQDDSETVVEDCGDVNALF